MPELVRMPGPDLIRLRLLTTSFRRAILRTHASKLPISLRGFPTGGCGDASLLLARFLEDAGFGQATFVAGSRGPYTHAWLELEDVQIDITADQFVRDPEKLLIVGQPRELQDGVVVTRERVWYDGFDEKRLSAADIDIYDESTKIRLALSYQQILSNL